MACDGRWDAARAISGCATLRWTGSVSDLCHETDYRIPQELAAASIARGAEAVLVPSATRLGDNLILFPSNIKPTSRIDVVNSRDPMLYVRH